MSSSSTSAATASMSSRLRSCLRSNGEPKWRAPIPHVGLFGKDVPLADLKMRGLQRRESKWVVLNVVGDGSRAVDVKESANVLHLAAEAAAAYSQQENSQSDANSRMGPEYSLDELKALEARVIVQTYGRAPVAFSSGKGSKLYDTDGKEYIDLSGGIAVNILGHSDPDWVKALTSQANQLAHVSNLYYTLPQILLAERLVNSSFADKVFFTNSGTEANEAAIKFARKYQRVKFQKESKNRGFFNLGPNQPATEFVAFSNCFHGRTIGALSLTSKEQYRSPFEPLMPGVTFATYGDLKSASNAIKKNRTAAVFVEPLQGEGGVNVATSEFLRGLRKLCDEAGALLVFDEVQCGLGRTGNLWAHEPYGVVPDIMTLAKPLAGGLPIGAVLTNDTVASSIAYGDHGSTFAGGPLVCHVALTVLDKIQEPGFLENVAARGDKMCKLLTQKLGNHAHVKEVRGRGLLIGIQLDVPAGPLVDLARQEGVLVITAGKGDVVRLVPPLIITEEELEKAADVLAKCISALG